MDTVIARLKQAAEEYERIERALMSDEASTDLNAFKKLSKQRARLQSTYEGARELAKLDENIAVAEEMMKEGDREIKELAQSEKEAYEKKREALLTRFHSLLLTRDPDDEHDVIMEIRGGAGGDEGNIFAGDLYRMYTKYAEGKGWKCQVIEAHPSEAGGFAQIIFAIKGDNVYGDLKFESGVHRVQRVPRTEAQGRIHTSTATVLCQPEVEEEDIAIDPQDLKIETHRASGAGGQHINKTDSAVRIVHVPTGISVNCQEGRSQIENRQTAMRLIRARVYEALKKEREEAEGQARRRKIGTGDRSEKIRTYNYPQNRVSDHRIGLTVNQLDRIMEGKLDVIITALRRAEEERMIAGEDA